jgi:hypothetical protein
MPANNVPPTFAAKALGKRPRTTLAQAVVIPQEGHGMFQSITNVQGGKPSC